MSAPTDHVREMIPPPTAPVPTAELLAADVENLPDDPFETPEPPPVAAVARYSDSRWPRPTRAQLLLGVGVLIVSMLAVQFLLGAPLQARSQTVLHQQFADKLATAASTAGQVGLSPLPPYPPATGEPVALLRIPALGLSQVVTEGADGATLQNGPGHVPGTAGPGEPGNSVISAHRTAWGAAFRGLTGLRVGDPIAVTTVAGTARYIVTGTGTPDPLALTADNRLTLVTSDPPLLASTDYAVSAALQGAPFPPTAQNGLVDRPLHSGSPAAWAQLVFWLSLGLGLLAAVVVALRIGLARPVIWLLATPLALALLVVLTRTLDTFLPPTL